MSRWQRLAGLLFILAVVVVACGGAGGAVPQQGITQGSLARDFTLYDLDGNEVSLSDYEGDVVLVNLWATWCAPCRDEIPDLEAAYQANKDKGFAVLGVNIEEPAETVAPFVEELNMTYPVLLDENGEVIKTYRAQGLPMSLILDQDGVIQVRHMGYLTDAQLDRYLKKLLP